MPVVFRHAGYRVHFFSNEGDPREPVHVHATKGRDTAKFWLHPEVNVAYNRGLPPRMPAELSTLIEERRDKIGESWNEHFA